MQLSIYQVDAFSRGPFTGNPAAVVPLEEWLPNSVLQKIAEENNLSETAFFVPNDRKYHIRWFTPTVEVALCGHATVATGFVLFELMNHDTDRIEFTCKSGDIWVSRSGGELELDFPTDDIKKVNQAPYGLEAGLGRSPIDVYEGREDFLCIYGSENDIIELKPDFQLLSQVKGRGVIVSAPGNGEFDFVSRGFFPQSGINEDPATGSAHTTLTPYWHSQLGKTEFKACQLSKRRGFFKCCFKDDRVLISGAANLYLAGKITI